MFIQNNISSIFGGQEACMEQNKGLNSLERLCTGYQLNCTAESGSGLFTSEKMKAQIRGLNQASKNAQDGISLIQTAEGALSESSSILQNMRDLAVKAASGSTAEDERNQIQEEIIQLTREVDRIACSTEFNTMKLLDGSKRGIVKFEPGNIKVNGNFANGNINITEVYPNIPYYHYSSHIAKNDVIQIRILSDNYYQNTSYSVDSLYGTELDFTVSTGDIELHEARIMSDFYYYSYGFLSIAGLSEYYFRINVIDGRLEIGDVITISLESLKLPSSPEPGKEGIRLQIGANLSQELEFGIESMRAKDLNIISTNGRAFNMKTQGKASLAIEGYDKAIQKVAGCHSKLEIIKKRLEHTIAVLDSTSEKLQAAEKRICDSDIEQDIVMYD